MTIFKYALRRGFWNPISLSINCALPLAVLLFGGRINIVNIDASPTASSYTVALFIMYGAFVMARSIQVDKLDGVIVRILAGPITMRDYLVQNFLAAMIPMVFLSFALGVVGMIASGWHFTFALGAALCYVFLAATSIGLSFVWSCVFKNREMSSAVHGVFITMVATIGGMIIPLTLLPDAIFYLGALFPAHWAARSIGALYEHGFSVEYWLGIAAMFLFSAAYLLYGGKRGII